MAAAIQNAIPYLGNDAISSKLGVQARGHQTVRLSDFIHGSYVIGQSLSKARVPNPVIL